MVATDKSVTPLTINKAQPQKNMLRSYYKVHYKKLMFKTKNGSMELQYMFIP